MIYLVVVFVLLVLAIHYDINGKTINRDFWYRLMLLTFILIAGLRWRLGLDTPNYLGYFYHNYPPLSEFSFENYTISNHPLYVLINSAIISLGGRFFVVQLIQSSIVNILIFKYIRKHSSYIFTCIFFYFTCYCYTEFNMEIMKGGISIVICLFAFDYILEKKILKGFALLVLALLFHVQTLILFVLPIFFFLRLNKTGVIFIIGAFVLGYCLQLLLGEYVFLLENLEENVADKAEGYAESDKYGNQIHNWKYISVFFLPWAIYSLLSLLYMKKRDAQNSLLRIEPIAIIGIMFIMIQLNFQIAYRFVDYFRIHFLLLFTELFYGLAKDNRLLSRSVAYVRAFVVFVPLFFMIFFNNYLRRVQYYPYSSVIERTIDKHREHRFMETQNRPRANRNEF